MSEKKKMLPDKCAVARDLMALCMDGVASDASQRRVKKHVIDCEGCANFYQEMQTQVELDVPEKVDNRAFEAAVRKVKHKKRWRTVRWAIACAALAVVLVLAGLQAWQYFIWDMQPLDKNRYSVELARTDSWVLASVDVTGSAQICTKYEMGTLYIWAETSRMGAVFSKQPTEQDVAIGPWQNEGLYNGSNLVERVCVGYPVGSCRVIYAHGQQLPMLENDGQKVRMIITNPLSTPMPTPVEHLPDATLSPFRTFTPEQQQEIDTVSGVVTVSPQPTPTPRPQEN